MNNIDKILERHNDDLEQKKFIISDKNTLVIAPAGSGKTDALISKINYIIETKQLRFPKKILVLTLSNVAKYTVEKRLKFENKKLVHVYNFHSLASRILFLHSRKHIDFQYKYDYNLYNLKYKDKYEYYENKKIYSCFDNIDSFNQEIQFINENTENILCCKDILSNFLYKIKNIKEYISYEEITYFAIILLNFFKINRIYKNLYSHIFIDECQDINLLQLIFIKSLYSYRTNIFFLGDTFQSIMKFAGARGKYIEKDIDIYFDIKNKIELKNNYRVDNKDIVNFQKKIRDVKLDLKINYNNNFIIEKFDLIKEINFIFEKIKEIVSKDKNNNIAILCTTQFTFTQKDKTYLLQNLKNNGISYINTLNIEEMETKIKSIIDKLDIKNYKNIIKEIENINSELSSDMIALVDGYNNFCLKNNINFGETIEKILKEKELIKYTPYITYTKVNILTIHKAKGAEWDYVFIPFLNKDEFIHNTTCKECINKYNCSYKTIENNEYHQDFYQSFYVAITRAKKGLFITSTIGKESCLFYHATKLINI